MNEKAAQPCIMIDPALCKERCLIMANEITFHMIDVHKAVTSTYRLAHDLLEFATTDKLTWPWIIREAALEDAKDLLKTKQLHEMGWHASSNPKDPSQSQLLTKFILSVLLEKAHANCVLLSRDLVMPKSSVLSQDEEMLCKIQCMKIARKITASLDGSRPSRKPMENLIQSVLIQHLVNYCATNVSSSISLSSCLASLQEAQQSMANIRSLKGSLSGNATEDVTDVWPFLEKRALATLEFLQKPLDQSLQELDAMACQAEASVAKQASATAIVEKRTIDNARTKTGSPRMVRRYE